LHDSIESVDEIKAWQEKLVLRLAKQLQSDEIKIVVSEFIDSLQGEIAIPYSLPDFNGIANYLVNNKDHGDIRYDRVLMFLNVANRHVTDQKSPDDLYVLFSYLLQTLVRKCDESEEGLTSIPVNRRETLELISASKTTTPFVPGYDTENLEFNNGQRSSRLSNIGDYQPATGSWDIETVCLEMAQKLLKDLNDPDFNSTNALKVLMGRLNRYRLNPEESRLQGVYIHQEQLRTHPLGSQGVAEAFKIRTNNTLSLFVYGNKELSEILEVLHTHEENIRGMVVEDNKVLENYNRAYGITKAVGSTQQNKEQENNMTSIQVRNIGSGATINLVTGDQTNSQVGQGNIQISKDDIAQLTLLLDQLKSDAAHANDVSKQAYAAIEKVTGRIETEIKKSAGADKSVLTQAKDVLSGFKDIASIVGSVEKVTELLLPFIG
jgi:hypothetical protein